MTNLRMQHLESHLTSLKQQNTAQNGVNCNHFDYIQRPQNQLFTPPQLPVNSVPPQHILHTPHQYPIAQEHWMRQPSPVHPVYQQNIPPPPPYMYRQSEGSQQFPAPITHDNNVQYHQIHYIHPQPISGFNPQMPIIDSNQLSINKPTGTKRYNCVRGSSELRIKIRKPFNLKI